MTSSLALIYNGINSSIDHYRGKHDVYGGMAAGALTGALFKSTGKNLLVAYVNTTSCLTFVFSGHSANACCRYSHDRSRWGLESGETIFIVTDEMIRSLPAPPSCV